MHHPRLESTWLKIARAEQHMKRYHPTLKPWFELPPCTVVPEIEADTGDKIWRVVGKPILPNVDIHPIIGDVLYNFRSALDHLAWQLVEINGGTPDDKTAFPLSRTAAHYERWGRTNVSGIARKAKTAIKNLQPCYGTHRYRVLWLGSLEYLSNVDKHRHFNLTAAATDGGLFNPGLPMNAKWFIHDGPIEDGTILCRVEKAHVGVDFHPALGIAFSDGPPAGESVYGMLVGIREIVKGIATDFEQAFFS